MDIENMLKKYIFPHICRWRPIYWKSLFSVCSLKCYWNVSLKSPPCQFQEQNDEQSVDKIIVTFQQ